MNQNETGTAVVRHAVVRHTGRAAAGRRWRKGGTLVAGAMMAATAASAAEVQGIEVNAGSQTYTVVACLTNFDSGSEFLASQPWWGNETIAQAIASNLPRTEDAQIVSAEAAEPLRLAVVAYTVQSPNILSFLRSLSTETVSKFQVSPSHSQPFVIEDTEANLAACQSSDGKLYGALAAAPSVEFSSDVSSGGYVSGAFTVTATFSEDVSDFSAEDISITNGSVGEIVGSGDSYRFTVTPAGEGEVSFLLPENTVVNGDSEGNAESASFTVVYDGTAPAVDELAWQNINDPETEIVTGPAVVSLTFSEEVEGLEAGDISVGKGSAFNLSTTDNRTYTFSVLPSPMSEGELTVSLDANVVTDPAGNGNTAASDTLRVAFDTKAPTVTLSAPSMVNDVFTVTASFSEEVEEVTEAHFSVLGGGVVANSLTGSGKEYSLQIQPDAESDYLAISVLYGSNLKAGMSDITDIAGNALSSGATKELEVDAVSPSVTLKSNVSGGVTNGVFEVTASFDEPVYGFSSEDLTFENGAFVAGSFTGADGDQTYTFEVEPAGDGETKITIADGVAQDEAGNDNVGASYATQADLTAPVVTLTSEAGDVVSERFTIAARVSEEVSGFDEDDISVSGGALVMGSFDAENGVSYRFEVDPELGGSVVVTVRANAVLDAAENGNALSELTVQAGSPASAFAAVEDEVREVLQEDAMRSLSSTIATNRRLTRAARTRYMLSRRQMAGEADGLVSRNTQAFDVDGNFVADGLTLSTKGTFFQQYGNYEGTKRRLFFGDFDVQHDSEDGSTTATLSGKFAWERMLNEDLMLGYYLGADYAHSDLDGTFAGDQDSYAVSVGGYGVMQLSEAVFLDGFVSLGMGQNDLQMSDGILELESDYTTQTLSFGGAVTGVITKPGFEIWPELAMTFGRTWLGNVDFTGRAYGLVDNNLSLDAGRVTLANVTLRPEFRVPVTALGGLSDTTLVTFAPRLVCEWIESDESEYDCGGGAEFGFEAQSADGRTRAKTNVMMERVGDNTRTALQVKLEFDF